MPLTFKRVFVTVSTLLLTPFVALLSMYSWIHFGGNFHEVVKHEIYRSGQLSSVEFREKSQELGLRSVLNLRGANQDATWYQEEVENASRLGILHMDVSLSAGTALDTEQMEGLLQMIRKAPKPLSQWSALGLVCPRQWPNCRPGPTTIVHSLWSFPLPMVVLHPGDGSKFRAVHPNKTLKFKDHPKEMAPSFEQSDPVPLHRLTELRLPHLRNVQANFSKRLRDFLKTTASPLAMLSSKMLS